MGENGYDSLKAKNIDWDYVINKLLRGHYNDTRKQDRQRRKIS